MRVLLVSFLFISFTSFSQEKKSIEIPTFQTQTDTSPLFLSTNKLRQQINLPDLRESKDSFHFRFWTDIQAIDIWTTGKGIYQGSITNYAQRYNEKLPRHGKYEVDKVFSNHFALDTVIARRIFNMLETLSIITIPTDDKIKGWKQGFDGIEFLIETSSPITYSFKTYWTPSVFADSIAEAKKIQILASGLFEHFRLGKYYQKLKIQNGHYKRNGITGIYVSPSFNPNTHKTSIFDLL
jgi:hypothetical protein